MSVMPPFEIGICNAWIFIALLFFTYIPGQMINKEALNKVNEGWASEQWTRTNRLLANMTHMVIIPLTIIYSVFLPIKMGTVWFYVGLPFCLLGLVMNLVAGINIATTPLDKQPITKGIYRFSRHPAYFGGFLLYLGIGLVSASWAFILLALAWIIMWCIAVASEEQSLLKKYGDAYREYMNRTPRWIGMPKSSILKKGGDNDGTEFYGKTC
jgi:protein-S-isoprenylcysteine O-methyltransferase Ste14